MNTEWAETAIQLKLMAVAVVSGTFFGGLFAPGAALPFFNVGLSTLGMAAAGSMIGFAYGTPVTSRRKLYGYAIGGTFIGVWVVQILPSWLGWQWYSPTMEGPMAGIVALLSRWLVSSLIEHIPVIWDKFIAAQASKSNKHGGD